MYYAGIDAHTKSSTIWMVDRKGQKVSSSTVMTSTVGFAAGLGRWACRGLKSAVEASGITPWICQLLKGLGVNSNKPQTNQELTAKSVLLSAERLTADGFGSPLTETACGISRFSFQ